MSLSHTVIILGIFLWCIQGLFNAVSFTDYRHYHSNKQSYHGIRRASDRLYKEHGLSVVVLGQNKSKSYIEHTTTQAWSSYKAKLKEAIDRLIPAATDFEDLLRRLRQENYEIKRGQYVSGSQRYGRLRGDQTDRRNLPSG